MEPAATPANGTDTPEATTTSLPPAVSHTLSTHHEPVHAPEVPLEVVLPAPSPAVAKAISKPAGRMGSLGKLKSAATKLIADQRTKRKPSALFAEVKHYMTWLDVEKKLEEEYRSIQERSFVMMMKAKVVVGDGSRAARSIGVNPFAENRVVLSKLEGDSDSDSTFINASYIDGGMRPNEYIAAAMPHNDVTRCDFWRMVLEQRTKMIAMLNDETEQHSQGYWPTEVNKPQTYGSVTVTLIEKKNLVNSSDCILRKLKVQDTTKSSDVFHLQYKEWQDYGIPQEKEDFTKWTLEFDKLYEEMQGREDVGPIVAHCLQGDTRVTLASGISMHIKDLVNMPTVLSLSKNNTFVPVTPTAHILRAQPKDCIELIFNDGRALICTPDHQVMTTNGWKRADELIARESRVIAGPDAPLYDPAEDDPEHLLAFTINLSNVGVTLRMMCPQDIARAHAFARILGYFVTDGSMVVSKRWDSYSGKLSLGHQIDVDQALTDIQLINLPVTLLRDLHHAIGIQSGKRVIRATTLPGCVMQPNCPKSFVREFLGGLFGGDGHAPYPANHTNSWHSVAFSMSKVTEHVASIEDTLGQIAKLLARFNIITEAQERLDDVTSNYPDSVPQLGKCVWRRKLLVPLDQLVAFHERIGFRYCAHKQQRLTVAAAYVRMRNYSLAQRQRFIERVAEISSYIEPPFYSTDSKRKKLQDGLMKAYQLTKAEKEHSEIFINKQIAIPSYTSVKKTLNGTRKLKSGTKDRHHTLLHEWLAEVGALEFFSEPHTAVLPAVAQLDGAEPAAKKQHNVRYGVSRALDGFPNWSVAFVGARAAGSHSTYDISVPVYHNFLAEGIVVHNCFGGVGRTGTFLLVHATYQKIKRIGGKAMEIENILALMRHKRANMVQTAEQYKFCYRMLLELYEGRRSLVSVLSILRPKD